LDISKNLKFYGVHCPKKLTGNVANELCTKKFPMSKCFWDGVAYYEILPRKCVKAVPLMAKKKLALKVI
jgi:hypothetical protein